MADPLFHVSATAQCPHAPPGQVQVVPSQTRVKVSNQLVATMNDQFTVTPCGFVVGSSSHPCSMVTFTTAATRVKVMGAAVILKTSVGVCKAADQATQGAPSIRATQERVKGT